MREVVTGTRPILWGLIWRDAEAKWLPFLALITLLVFWRNGLYAEREYRAGHRTRHLVPRARRRARARVRHRHGYHFTTFAIFPTALLFTAVLIGVLRASYDVMTKDIFRLAGLTRRAVLVGAARTSRTCARPSARDATGSPTSSSARSRRRSRASTCRCSGRSTICRASSRPTADELIVTDSDFGEEELLRVIDVAHRSGVKVRIAPKTTELLTQRAEYVPGQGVPLFELRPPAFAGTDWAIKRAFDLVVSVASSSSARRSGS